MTLGGLADLESPMALTPSTNDPSAHLENLMHVGQDSMKHFEDALSASMGLRGKGSGAVGQASSPFAFAGEMQRELWRLWNTAFTRTPGAKSSLKAGRGDKRFKDEAWQEAPYFDLLKQ